MSASEDIRFQMALTAASRERANRPRALIVGAGALFVVAALIALVGLGARARAASGLRAEARRQGDVVARIRELETLRAAQEAAATPTGEPLSVLELAQKMGDIAQEVGMKDRLAPPREISETRGRIVVKRYTFQNVRNAELAPMIEWLARATREVPGLEVFGLELVPDASGWNMTNLTLRRWERAP